MATFLRILIFNSIFFSAAFVHAADMLLGDLQDGKALITTRSGEVTFTKPNGKAEKADLHKLIALTGMGVTTGKNGHTFLSLSNGIALGIYENTELRIKSYRQQPFRPGKESMEYEPSRSELIIELVNGSLSFDSERISPLSKFVLLLPKGQIRPHKSAGRVVYDAAGAHITIIQGIATYDYPNSEEREFISGPNKARISDQSALSGRIAESVSPESDPSRQETELLVKATIRANDRVLYRVSTEKASIPLPVLIAKPETLQQPSPRPYRYVD